MKKKDKTSNQQKLYYDKNRGKIFLQKKNTRSIHIGDLVLPYVELEKKIKSVGRKRVEHLSIITHINVCIHYIYSYNCM